MTPFGAYLDEIKKNLAHGDATEHTHRPALKKLLESVSPGIIATNEPSRILCGAPDFILTKGKIPLGHVETKDVGENLAAIEKGKPPSGEQFGRYLDGLPNWILTDYLEFCWYVSGEHRMTVRLAKLDGKKKLQLLPDGEKELANLLRAFLTQKSKTIGTAKDLAGRMAGMTRIIRDLIIKTFEHEVEKGFLHKWLAAFHETLIPDLEEKQFADMFAQTLAYGLFAARVHTPVSKEFSREMAAYNLPKTNPFLRKLFSEIAGVDMPETIDWAVDDLVELLNRADMAAVLKDFGKGKGKEDPVVHFYETFLAAYDPKMRELRGVYYTPEPVVSYIVRSVDHLLKTRFNRTKGLADENTLILDPATGTATFLYFVVEQIYQKFAKQKGAWDGYVEKHLLNRIFGFELLIAPYAIAHLKLGMQLQQGVAICFCIKERGNTKPAQVFHADLWGNREAKYEQLTESDIIKTAWEKLKPSSPFYLFVPQNIDLRSEYQKALKITEIMPSNNVGFVTARDGFAIDFDEQVLRLRIETFREKEEMVSTQEIEARFSLKNTSSWNVKEARAKLRANPHWKKDYTKCLYRPFDIRYIYYSRDILERPVYQIQRHLIQGENLALLTCRQQATTGFQHILCSKIITECCAVSLRTREITSVFPLYLYDDTEAEDKKTGGGTMLMALFDSSAGYSVRRANLNPKFIQDLTQRLGLKWLPVDSGDLKKTVGPEDFFNYAYAVFHSPTYRSRYAEFLKIDFPRLPLTSDLKLFRSLAAKGAELVALHLMESPKLDTFITEFNVKGSDEVEKVQYTDNDKRVWINPKQFFAGVPKAVWEFHVGGYQVCEKWLKDRKGRKLTYEDIQHYQKTVVALSETIRLMMGIDEAITEQGGWPLK